MAISIYYDSINSKSDTRRLYCVAQLQNGIKAIIHKAMRVDNMKPVLKCGKILTVVFQHTSGKITHKIAAPCV